MDRTKLTATPEGPPVGVMQHGCERVFGIVPRCPQQIENETDLARPVKTGGRTHVLLVDGA